jgi:multiple antibiotic resistance protein
MHLVSTYFILGFSALLPIINPPGSALELLQIVGLGEEKPYKHLARKVAVNTVIFLTVTAIAGPQILQFFGISIEILQLMGGLVLVALGWRMLNREEGKQDTKDPDIRQAAADCVTNYWTSRAFYPLTFPITVGPGSVAIMLTLGVQARGLELREHLWALVGLTLSLVVMSVLIYLFYAYAPKAAQRVSPSVVQAVMRIVAFLLLCIGGQIAWNGLHTLLKSMRFSVPDF